MPNLSLVGQTVGPPIPDIHSCIQTVSLNVCTVFKSWGVCWSTSLAVLTASFGIAYHRFIFYARFKSTRTWMTSSASSAVSVMGPTSAGACPASSTTVALAGKSSTPYPGPEITSRWCAKADAASHVSILSELRSTKKSPFGIILFFLNLLLEQIDDHYLTNAEGKIPQEEICEKVCRLSRERPLKLHLIRTKTPPITTPKFSLGFLTKALNVSFQSALNFNVAVFHSVLKVLPCYLTFLWNHGFLSQHSSQDLSKHLSWS